MALSVETWSTALAAEDLVAPPAIFQLINLANNRWIRSCCWIRKALHPIISLNDMPGEGVSISDSSVNIRLWRDRLPSFNSVETVLVVKQWGGGLRRPCSLRLSGPSLKTALSTLGNCTCNFFTATISHQQIKRVPGTCAVDPELMCAYASSCSSPRLAPS